MIKTFSQIYENAQEWKEILNMKYEDFVKHLSDVSSDPRIKPFLGGGQKDGKPMDEKIKFHTRLVKVSKLKPTQNEIDLDKSLMFPLSCKVPEQLRQVLEGNNIVIKAPIVTLNGAFVLDGHHRWSQVYAMNSDAVMVCYDIQLAVNPIDMLKIIQMSIADDLGYIPTAKVDGKNMLKINLKEIENYIETNISNAALGLLLSEGKIDELDKELSAKYIISNIVQMRKTSTPVKGAPSRNVMPQTDDTEQWDDKLKNGDINFKDPVELVENEINEMSKKDHHFKRIVKMFDEGGNITKAKIAKVIKHSTKISKEELESELEEMDIDDIYDIEKQLGINESRKISDIAKDINNDWQKVNFAAKPYLDAMFNLSSTKDMYGMDSADSIVRYFLSNASSWKGDKAKEIKKELNQLLKENNKVLKFEEYLKENKLHEMPKDGILGHTNSKKPVYLDFDNPAHKDFTKQDHKDAGYILLMLKNDIKDINNGEKTREYWKYDELSDLHYEAANNKK